MLSKLTTLIGLTIAMMALASPAHALTMAECSAKYQAAKDAGALKGMKWNEFRKAECGSEASAAGEAAKPTATKAPEAAASDGAKGLTMAECSAKYQAAKAADTLKGMKWNEFRKAECGPGASSAAVAKPTETKPTATTTPGGGGGAKGLTMSECSTKYKAAKEAGTLKMKWNEFRKAECGPGAADDDSVPSKSEANYRGEPETPTAAAPMASSSPQRCRRNIPRSRRGRHECTLVLTNITPIRMPVCSRAYAGFKRAAVIIRFVMLS